jgi:hypothetical protein
MALDIHALMQDTHYQDMILGSVIEDDMFPVMVGAQRRMDRGAQPAYRRIFSQHLKTFAQRVVIRLRLRCARPGVGVIKNTIDIGRQLLPRS